MRPKSHPHARRSPTLPGMSPRAVTAACVCALALSAPASASAGGSGGQVGAIRGAAANFVGAELSGNGAGACALLSGSLRATRNHRTCAQRWDAKLAKLLAEPAARASLHSQQRAIPSAPVHVRGGSAWIELPAPLMAGSSRLVWVEDCWMLGD
jgi:hypothetical protein